MRLALCDRGDIQMIVIVDYGMGNLKSVANAAQLLGSSVQVSSSPAVIRKAEKIIFPGVGHFGRAVKELRAHKLFDPLKDALKQGVPFLGICLGMQILFETSEEAPGIPGFGVMRGTVKRFQSKRQIVPHMGWNQIRAKRNPTGDTLLRGIKDGSFFYFVHSYYCEPRDREAIVATTLYGIDFASVIHKDNLWAVQFHAEKSQKLGLRLFHNFLRLC